MPASPPGGPVPAMTDTSPARGQAISPGLHVPAGCDPRDLFLTAEEVHVYLGVGRTKGYEITGSALYQHIAVAEGRWRLSDLRALHDAIAATKISEAVAEEPPSDRAQAGRRPASRIQAETLRVPAPRNGRGTRKDAA